MGCRTSSVGGAGSSAIGTVSGVSSVISTGEFSPNICNKGQCTVL